jgi:ADP-ribose pyrophosphatase YjhB (NUDIX family)
LRTQQNDDLSGQRAAAYPDLPRWLRLARELQALSQIGLTYSQDEYDRVRYLRLAAIAAEIVAAQAELEQSSLVAGFLAQPGYATPKVDVRAAIVRGDRIVLVQERSDGRWAMPGGWADVGATPTEMVAREVREECGLEVAPTRLVGVFDANRVQEPLALYHAYKLVFLCQVTGGALAPGDETLAAGWFGFEELPELSSNRTDARHLAAVRAIAADAHAQPWFD